MSRKVVREAAGDVRVEPVSDSVSFQYSVEDGERKHEGLVASGRWYPAIRGKDRFLFGLRQGNRFVPGVLWCDTFIPGLVIRDVFVPGIVAGDKYVPGVIASGVFMPGIIQGRQFVPGLVNNHRFVPGAFTSDHKFAPGLIRDGGFSIGLVDGGSFVSIAAERIPPKEVEVLSRDGYGFPSIRRFQHLGGVPLAGAVLATFRDTGFLTYRGLLTDSFLVIGGLREGQDLAVMDPMQSFKEALGAMGIDIGGPDGGKAAQDRFEQMTEDFVNGLFGTGVGTWQSGGAPSLFGETAAALEGLGKGANDILDRMNQQWEDYWDDLLGGGPGSAMSGGWITDAEKAFKVIGGATATGAGLGAIAGSTGATIGGIVGFIVGVILWLTKSEEKPPSEKPPSGTAEPGEEGGEPGFTLPLGGSHPMPLMPYVIYRTQLIQVDLGEYDMSVVPSLSTKAPAVKMTMTDTGVVVILNYQAMRAYARSHARTGGTMVVNLLTGETEIWYLPHVAVVVGEDVPVPFWIRHVAHPQH